MQRSLPKGNYAYVKFFISQRHRNSNNAKIHLRKTQRIKKIRIKRTSFTKLSTITKIILLTKFTKIIIKNIKKS